MNKESKKLPVKDILKIGVPIFILAAYVKFLMDHYRINLKEPPKDLEPKNKNQKEIIEAINQILENGDSVVGCLFPHTSIADHVVFNKELQRWSEYETAWIATKKFIEGKMGFAGILAQAWFHIDRKMKMFWVTQAYLRDKMSPKEAEAAKTDNMSTVSKAIEFLTNGSGILYFYPEGTRVKKSKKNELEKKVAELARAHPSAFNTAEKAAFDGEKKIYLAPMHLGDVPDGKLRVFLPASTELTYGEPIDITQLREKFSKIEGKIKFTTQATKYHRTRNPAKKRRTENGEKQFDDDGKKLYTNEPADFGFADYVMWTFAKLMPLEKRGIYGYDCVQIE